MAPEESQSLIVSSGLPIEDFKLLTFTDIPAGEKRYILCSRQVEDTIMNKLNTAIDAYIVGTKFTRSLLQALIIRGLQERPARHVVNRAQKSRQKAQNLSSNSL